ncbi:hypothetical protein [Haladaptatus sp. DFWS20]|uniref:hypothetical protein n=1 Tax=Haladaptatus sp. DFWS20 TaxID=3403467 RepID=UPI003EBEE803
MLNSNPPSRPTRRTVLRSAAIGVTGLGALGEQAVGAITDTDQTPRVITKDAEAGNRRVTLFGNMTGFGGHENVWVGFTYKKKGTMSGSYGEEIKLWNPDAPPNQLQSDDQRGPAFSLTFDYGNEGVSDQNEEWRLRPGTTYIYQAQARLPRDIGSVPLFGKHREFTIPCND